MNQYENPQAGKGRPMPKREQELFKSVVKHYETKQYKKGLKAADSILKKFPNHGETLCMKGLILNMTSSKTGGGGATKKDAVDMVKLGLMKDMSSHVCWHVYGLIYRSERDYNEAIKAYKQALRIDSENLQILRDLSLLQIQMRDLDGFDRTRHSILTLKPNQKVNWLTFALSKHLIGDLRGAIGVIDIYLGTLKEDDDSTKVNQEENTPNPDLVRGYESSELALYKNALLSEIPNNWTEALAHLDKSEHLIVDNLSLRKSRGRYQLQLQLFDDALSTFTDLLKQGHTEDYSIHSGYMCALLKLDGEFCEEAIDAGMNIGMGIGRTKRAYSRRKGTDTPATMRPLSKDQRRVLLLAYRKLAQMDGLLGKSLAVHRIPLTILKYDDSAIEDNSIDNDEDIPINEAKEWAKAIDNYCRSNISRGVPSLGSDLCSLLLIEDPITKRYRTAVEPLEIKGHPIYHRMSELIDSYIASLEQHSVFPKIHDDDSDTYDKIEPPSTLLWAWYLRSHLHELAHEYSPALALASKCLEQTPTAVDIYELRGRLMQKAGDYNAAANSLDEGRKLDKQDRFINNRTTEYLLQANREVEALERISMFTRHESDPEQNVFDMQCIWYELELAACYARQRKWGKSFKKYVAVEKHFEDFNEDQFDFHSYCIRRVTLRSYIDVLNWEDTLYGNQYYAIAAEGIIKNYLRLHDNPDIKRLALLGDDAMNTPADYSAMLPAEKKKAKAQARKKKKAAEKKKAKMEEEAEARRLKLEKEGDKGDGGGNQNNGKQGKKSASSDALPSAMKDDDPDGKALLEKDALEEAKRYAGTLVKNAPIRFSTWICQYDVSIRRGKFMMALQALVKAKALDPNSSELFTRIVDLKQKQFSPSPGLPTASTSLLQEVFESERSKLLSWNNETVDNNITLSDYVANVASSIKNDTKASLTLRISVAKAMLSCGVGTVSESISIITEKKLQVYGVTLEGCKESLSYLKQISDNSNDCSSCIEEWNSLIKQYYPLADLE